MGVYRFDLHLVVLTVVFKFERNFRKILRKTLDLKY